MCNGDKLQKRQLCDWPSTSWLPIAVDITATEPGKQSRQHDVDSSFSSNISSAFRTPEKSAAFGLALHLFDCRPPAGFMPSAYCIETSGRRRIVAL